MMPRNRANRDFPINEQPKEKLVIFFKENQHTNGIHSMIDESVKEGYSKNTI